MVKATIFITIDGASLFSDRMIVCLPIVARPLLCLFWPAVFTAVIAD